MDQWQILISTLSPVYHLWPPTLSWYNISPSFNPTLCFWILSPLGHERNEPLFLCIPQTQVFCYSSKKWIKTVLTPDSYLYPPWCIFLSCKFFWENCLGTFALWFQTHLGSYRQAHNPLLCSYSCILLSHQALMEESSLAHCLWSILGKLRLRENMDVSVWLTWFEYSSLPNLPLLITSKSPAFWIK